MSENLSQTWNDFREKDAYRGSEKYKIPHRRDYGKGELRGDYGKGEFRGDYGKGDYPSYVGSANNPPNSNTPISIGYEFSKLKKSQIRD